MIQISGFGPCDPKQAGGGSRAGLDVCVTHMPWAKLEDPRQLDELIADHNFGASDQIGLAPAGNVFENTYEGYTKFIAEWAASRSSWATRAFPSAITTTLRV